MSAHASPCTRRYKVGMGEDTPCHVRVATSGAVTTITLDRPEARNAYSEEMIVQLVAAFDAAERDRDVRCVILTGAGKGACEPVSGAAINASADTITPVMIGSRSTFSSSSLSVIPTPLLLASSSVEGCSSFPAAPPDDRADRNHQAAEGDKDRIEAVEATGSPFEQLGESQQNQATASPIQGQRYAFLLALLLVRSLASFHLPCP